ncbi:hypothetical protein [Gordonia jinghuaiqii]|uniref:hypothetical protein n=1 Tax=Gordonia jinghuaiqii TaxID=2758710 RepID=UPI001FCFB991|nr:hypothetical protein [Gordonia jinghuaiqii]
MPTPDVRLRRPGTPRTVAVAGLIAAVGLALGACSADPEPASSPSTTPLSSTAQISPPQSSTPPSSPEASSTAATANTTATRTGDGEATSLTCKQFRAQDDAAREETVTQLGVTSNAQQVAAVAATVCLSRPDDKISDVVDELVPR